MLLWAKYGTAIRKGRRFVPNTPPISGYGDMKVDDGYRVLRGHLAITNTALK